MKRNDTIVLATVPPHRPAADRRLALLRDRALALLRLARNAGADAEHNARAVRLPFDAPESSVWLR